jgi:hypothetical protein
MRMIDLNNISVQTYYIGLMGGFILGVIITYAILKRKLRIQGD